MIKLNGKMLSAFVFSALLVSGSAMAGCINYDHVTPYVGLDYNYSNIDAESVEKLPNDYSSVSGNVGAVFKNGVGVEAFYQESSEMGSENNSFNAYGIDVANYEEIGEKTDFITTAGVGQYEFEQDAATDDKGIGYRAGIGFLHELSEHWDARMLTRYVYVDNVDVVDDMMEVSLGLRYNFY